MTTKKCTKCEQEKPTDDFWKAKRGLYGRHSTCKSCKGTQRKIWGQNNREYFNEYMRKYNAEHPASVEDRRNKRFRTIKCRYGLTRDQFEQLLKTQNNQCAICDRIMERFTVDHCHTTGRVRGILCHSCNRSLHILDDRDLLERAIKYVSIGLQSDSI